MPDPIPTPAETLRRLRASLAAAGIAEAALDARVLLLAALGIDATTLALRADEPVEPAAAARLEAMAARRIAGEPVWRILGWREFWGLPFRLAPQTLVPRPDSETIVETALRLAPDPRRVLDLGTGTGCLLVAILHERPAAFGVGVDRAGGAAAAARDNARRNGVGERAGFLVGDWAGALAGGFDLLVSNPPYIPSADLAGLEREVREHDPALALDGGPDGLAPYRAILAEAPRLLRPGGVAVVEVGIGQADEVAAMGAAAGLAPAGVVPDLAGVPRAVAWRRD
jgi:release factor glutamine methyltransferase